MQVAIDTSVLIALIDPLDIWRTRAIALIDALLVDDVVPIYFDCVTAEAVSTAARRLHEKGRGNEVRDLLDRLEMRIPYELIIWILPDVPRFYSEALAMIRSSSGELNFNDALIALACRERNIPAIASFDPDFDQLPWLEQMATPQDVGAGG